MAYRYYATLNEVIYNTTPTDEEITNQDWLKPYDFMRLHWEQIENHFNNKAKTYWRVYLHLDK